MSSLYKQCIVHSMSAIIQELDGPNSANNFKRMAKSYLGVSNLDGMPSYDQINKINGLWRSILEPIPETTFIRSWLEKNESVEEYLLLFKHNWCKDIIRLGVLNRGK